MIGFLKGKVEILQRPFALIDVNGVGYKVLVSENVYKKLTTNENIKIFTYTYVREDALDLFGFLELEDLTLFENLITVSGIGPKTALNIFSFGTKNAQKIIIELKNKMGSDHQIDLSGKDFAENAQVIEALKGFGFTAAESQKALREIKGENLSLDEKIKMALKLIGSR